MRDIPEAMAARIESGAATLCHVWRLSRRDGVELGFTDHDRDLTVEGVVCRAASGWTAGAGESAVGPAAGSLAASGGLDDDVLTEADIRAGLYDGARVELWRVDWTQPTLAVRLWTATLTRLRREGDAFVAEMEGPLAALERVVGRSYGRDCDAQLGDGRCRVTCRLKFDNLVNFQGFPDIPGDDFLTVHPVGGGRHDGGSRR